MKTAKTYTTGIEVICPHCEEDIENPYNFALNWTLEEVTANGREVHCSNCGNDSLLPKRYFKIPA